MIFSLELWAKGEGLRRTCGAGMASGYFVIIKTMLWSTQDDLGDNIGAAIVAKPVLATDSHGSSRIGQIIEKDLSVNIRANPWRPRSEWSLLHSSV
jgi:hypothetical protein